MQLQKAVYQEDEHGSLEKQLMRRIFWSVQHGCTFFVAAEGDMLRLDDVFLQDAESGEFSRSDVSGELPREPALYQQVQSCAQCASDGSPRLAT